MRTLIISLIIVIIYFFGANFLAGILIEGEEANLPIKTISGMLVEIGVGDKVNFYVKRPRWYGTINESNNLSNLKLFNVVNLPIKVNGSSWIIYHLIAFGGLMVFVKIQLNKGRKKWESNLDGEYLSYS